MRLRALALTGSALAALVPVTASAATWTAPAVLTPRDGASYAVPHVASEAGRAVATWVRAPAATRGRARVHIAVRASRTSPWSRPVALSAPGADAPRVALNARGDAVVVWVAGRRLVAAVRRGAAGDWVVTTVADAGGAVQDLRAAIDVVGRPSAMWSESSGSGFVVRVAARASASAGWTVRNPRISTPGPQPPSLALARAGAVVAWTDDDGTRAARTVAGAFERPSELSRDVGAPTAAMSSGGVALGAWSAALPGGSSVVLAAGRARGAGGWAVSDDVGIGLRPAAALNDRGDAVVAWSLDEPGAPQGVEAATRRGGRGGWRATTIVPRRVCDCALLASSAAVDGAGVALVAWRRDDGASVGGGGAAALAPGALRWLLAPVSPGRMTGAPAVAADAAGGGVAVWVEAGPRGGVRAVTLRP